MIEQRIYQKKEKRFLWLLKILKWWYVDIPTVANGPDTTEFTTGRQPNCFVKYEINVSLNGKHVFATDSTIRSYSEEDIAKLVTLFYSVFPSCKIQVTSFGRSTPSLPSSIGSLLKN